MIRSVDAGRPRLELPAGAECLGERDVDLAAAADLHAVDGFFETRWELTGTGDERQRCSRFPRRIELLAVGCAEGEQAARQPSGQARFRRRRRRSDR